MARYTYEESLYFKLNEEQTTQFRQFLRSIWDGNVNRFRSVHVSADGDALAVNIRGDKVRNCESQADAEALLDDVLAGRLTRVSLKE